eukprot:6262199-Prymnesium_polylepis.2
MARAGILLLAVSAHVTPASPHRPHRPRRHFPGLADPLRLVPSAHHRGAPQTGLLARGAASEPDSADSRGAGLLCWL